MVGNGSDQNIFDLHPAKKKTRQNQLEWVAAIFYTYKWRMTIVTFSVFQQIYQKNSVLPYIGQKTNSTIVL